MPLFLIQINQNHCDVVKNLLSQTIRSPNSAYRANFMIFSNFSIGYLDGYVKEMITFWPPHSPLRFILKRIRKVSIKTSHLVSHMPIFVAKNMTLCFCMNGDPLPSKTLHRTIRGCSQFSNQISCK